MSDVIGNIGRQDWMEPGEQGLQNLVHEAFEFTGGRHAKNFLHGTWLGEPLHVILTDIPIGAWTAAIVFDAIDSMSPRGKDSGGKYGIAADAAVALGLVGAVGAAVTGLTDWQDIDPPARRIGLVHGVLNVFSTVLFGASLVARRKKARVAGRSLAALGYAVSVAAARLGGNLVYEHKIGIDHSDPEKLPGKFAPVMSESNLPDGKPVRVDHNGTPILLVRRGSQIYALAEACSHLGGPLSEGKLEDGIIECPWHGSRFSITDGHVIDGPAVHPQPCLEVRIRNDQIEVRKSDCRLLVEDKVPPAEIKTKSRPKRKTRTK